MFNRTTITALIGMIFAILAYFKVGLPDTMSQDAVVAVVLVATGLATAIARWTDGDEYAAGVKNWWQSRVIWTQVGAVISGGLALFGVSIGVTQEGFAETAMLIVTVASFAFGKGTQARIGSS